MMANSPNLGSLHIDKCGFSVFVHINYIIVVNYGCKRDKKNMAGYENIPRNINTKQTSITK